jgi:hypothetical protein
MAHLYIIDLDRTSFNTTVFVHDLINLLEHTFKLDGHRFKASIKQFTLPGEIGYDFYAHVQAVVGESPQAVNQLVAQRLQGRDYTYPDVAPWLANRTHGDTVVVMTVGETNYQKLKLHYAPPLRRLQALIVRENKGRVLRTALEGDDPLGLDLASYDRVTIVDDNPLTFSELVAVPHIRPIYMSRPGEKFSGQPVMGHVATVSSFRGLA